MLNHAPVPQLQCLLLHPSLHSSTLLHIKIQIYVISLENKPAGINIDKMRENRNKVDKRQFLNCLVLILFVLSLGNSMCVLVHLSLVSVSFLKIK